MLIMLILAESDEEVLMSCTVTVLAMYVVFCV